MQPVPNYILRFLNSLLVIILLDSTHAQITSPASDASGILDYFTDTVTFPDAPRTDPYFVFNAPEHNTEVTGSLVATAPAGTPGFNYNWSKYNPSTNSFDPPFHTEDSVATSSVSNLSKGCYRVQITSGDLDTMLRAWVFPNDPLVEVEKGIDGKVIPYRYTCDVLRLVGTARADTMEYYDLSTGASLYLPNSMSFEWTSDDPEYEIFGGKVFIELSIYNEPPYSRPPTKDTRFTLTAVDSFDLTRADDVLYESVHVEAGFTMWFEERGELGEEPTWTESESPEEESPMEVRFKNTSENGVEFQWSLVDSAKTGEESEIVTYNVDDSVVYTYYIPGFYYPELTAISEAGCVDSFPLVSRQEVHVLPSELDAPNVFTPNGDGVNDYFVVRSASLKSFRISIFNRNGRKIYEFEHTDGRMEWIGWDGTIHGKGNDFAQSGIYYYVIEALGWDATVYRGIEPYKGFVYLFREADAN